MLDEKQKKKNITMIAVSIVIAIASVIMTWTHFSKKTKNSINNNQERMVLQDGQIPISPANDVKDKNVQEDISIPLGEGEDFGQNDKVVFVEQDTLSLNLDIFERSSFLALKKYVDDNIAKQAKIIPKNNDFPPELQEIFVDDPGVGDRINIFWQPPLYGEFAKIKVYRFSGDKGRRGLLAELSKGKKNYIDIGTIEGNDYYYLIKTVNAAGEESKNTRKYRGVATNIIPPKRPSNVMIKQKNKEIEIVWTNPDDYDLKSIFVYKTKDQSMLGDIVAKEIAVPGKKYKIVDEYFELYEQYYYTLVAVDSAGNRSADTIIQLGNEDLFLSNTLDEINSMEELKAL